MTELVSVVIPTRNRCARLLEAVASALTQTGVDVEIIVVDDASSDETEQTMTALCLDEPRVTYVRNDTPQGGAAARNCGAALAKGAFIAFLDDDDQFLAHKLSRQVALLKERPEASAATCSFWIYYGDRRTAIKRIQAPSHRLELLKANTLGGASVCMVRASSFAAVGGFDPGLPSCQDWDLWLKLQAVGTIVVCDEPLVRYYFHSGAQITGNPVAEYRGRRRMYQRYANEMSPDIRQGLLAALIYYRCVRFGLGVKRKVVGLCQVIKLAPMNECLGYVWRTFRLALRGKLTP